MAIRQISVFVENRKGSLVEITRALSDADIDLRAAAIADTQDFGILRLIVSNTDKALETLRATGLAVTVTDVVGVAVPDVPGGLSAVLETLSDASIAVEYMYAFNAGSGRDAYVALRVDDYGKAEQILWEKGIRLLSQSDAEAL